MKTERILETERCYVREITLKDVPLEYELYDSPHMTDFIEPLWDPELQTEYQRQYIEQIYGRDWNTASMPIGRNFPTTGCLMKNVTNWVSALRRICGDRATARKSAGRS